MFSSIRVARDMILVIVYYIKVILSLVIILFCFVNNPLMTIWDYITYTLQIKKD